MNDVKDTNNEWFPQIPVDWKIERLKNLTATTNGITFTKADLVEEGNAVLSYGQIHAKSNPQTYINSELIKYIPDKLVQGKAASKVKKEDFLFADTSEDLAGCGNCIYIDKDIDLYAGYHTIILQNKDLGCGGYFAYLFMSDDWRIQIRKRVKSVKLFSVTQNILNQTFALIPPIEQQEAIAAYLEKECERIRRRIALLERKADAYSRLRRSLINRAVTRGLNPDVSLKPSGNSWIGDIPQHWHTDRNKTILIERKDTVDDDASFQLLSLSLGGVVIRDLDAGGKFPAEFNSYKKVYPNNLVFCLFDVDETPRTIGLSAYTGMITGAYNIFDAVSSTVIPEWVYYFYFSIDQHKALKPYYTGLRKVVKAQNFANIHIPIPPIEEQKAIVSYLDEKCAKIDAIVEKINHQIERLKELKRSLINEVVTGKRAIN